MSTNKSIDELAYEYCEKDQYPTGFSGFKAGFTARDSEVQALREALTCAESALKSTVGFEPFNSLEPIKCSEALTRIAAIKKSNGIL